MLVKRIFKSKNFRIIALLVFSIVVIKILAYNAGLVEEYFSSGFFQTFSIILRLFTGWLPFSIGDLLYFFTGIFLLYKVITFFIKLIKRKIRINTVGKSLVRILILSMAIYIIFNIFWGLNYNREGIAHQLNLQTTNYTAADLQKIQQLLVQKVNKSKQVLISNHSVYPTDKELFTRANKCYQQTQLSYAFLQYKQRSVKSSVFSWWGNYLGFTGYYNPFTGEAQLNTTVPRFILPFTTCHEMAHQIGYAKEDEANFVGYLAATSSTDTFFHYSTYLDLFLYANHQVYYSDSVLAKHAFAQLSPAVKADIKEWKDFLIRHRSFADAIVTWAYGKYLKANQQPKGMYTYNEVIADLIAFYKKTGKI